MSTHRQNLGRWGEARAAEYLQSIGYEIVGRNVRTRFGELDVVARQAGVTVFVEVKTRSSTSLGPPEISVTPAKLAHIYSSAQSYLMAHPEYAGDWRVDVIAIQRRAGDQPAEIVHFENALT